MTVVTLAAVIYLGAIPSPPNLMDDVDAVQAQISRNMLESGDWVTARLNGIAYLEKAPLHYWFTAVSFGVFGVHDWAARIPLALGVVGLCWLVSVFGRWAFGETEGLFAGVILASCTGLWLFTRIQIPDAALTASITLALWSLLRVLDAEEPHPRVWNALLFASLGVGLLLKGLIAAVLPAGAAAVYLAISGERRKWRRFRLGEGLALLLLVAAPWHVLATLRNPPWFDFTMKSEPGQYRGFFWFFFLNEHLFRFLNMRHPRYYNTVPRYLFWLLHLVWLFPWTAHLAGLRKLGYRPIDRAARTRLLALCWAGFVLVFFTFSTTQEYYSMPAYPALALLLASGLARGGRAVDWGARITAALALAVSALLFGLWGLSLGRAAPGDISRALSRNVELYTLSLGHMADLTLGAFAYLRTPLVVAAVAFLAGGVCAWKLRGQRLVLSLACMIALFFFAARLALKAFDPYMGSRALAERLLRSPEGRLIVDNQYYAFSSVFFYTNRRALLLNGRINNLEYGSYAPGAPDVFIDDSEFREIWRKPDRAYLCVEGPQVGRIERLVGRQALIPVVESGGKHLFTNQPLP